MKYLLIVFLSIGFLCSMINCAEMVLMVAVADAIDRTKHTEEETYRIFPYSEDKVLRTIYFLCEEEHGLKSFKKAEGLIETKWITEKYSRNKMPVGFITKIKQYGSSPSRYETKWCGIRYKYLVSIMSLSERETRVKVQAKLEAYNYWYKGWRWWNSHGTLEHLFLIEVEKYLKET